MYRGGDQIGYPQDIHGGEGVGDEDFALQCAEGPVVGVPRTRVLPGDEPSEHETPGNSHR